MAQMSLHNELLNQQQDTIISFIESLEKEISQNSQWVQSLIEQCSSDLPIPILGQEEEYRAKKNRMSSSFRYWRICKERPWRM